MARAEEQKTARIAEYIDENLKKVFSDLARDDMPDQITDLLSVLRAQDEDQRGRK